MSGNRAKRGDAQAVFEAFAGGGWAIRLHSELIEGAPADFMSDSKVRISPMAAYNGRHYCALDWHVICVAAIEGNRDGESFTNSQIFDRLAARGVTFTLDGETLETKRTPPKRTLNPRFRDFYEAFYVNIGRLMAPDELSVGQHTLRAVGNNGQVLGTITYHIDAPGTGACVA